MDIERTMGFILETQTRTFAALERLTERQDRAERRIERLERLARLGAREFARHRQAMVEHDRRIVEIEQRFGQRMAALDQKLDRLAEMQTVTEQKLQAFFDSLRKGNGRQ